MNGVLLADEMGTGKSIQAIAVCNAAPLIHRILIVCPAFLKDNWFQEFSKWDVKGLSVEIVRTGRIKNGKKISFPSSDVVIMNYELLSPWRGEIREVLWDIGIFDEIHYLKNKKALRTAEVFGQRKFKEQEFISPIKARRYLFLSGTPVLNKPRELWTIIKAFDPNGLGKDQFAFDKQYCAGHYEAILPKSRLTFGGNPVQYEIGPNTKKVWVNTGSSNERELQDYLRSKFMIRRLRSEVLPQLPPTQRQIVVLDIENIANILKIERRTYEEFGDSIADLDIASPAFGEISKVRALLGVKKVPFIVDRVRESLADTKKIVVFVHHHEVIDLLAAEFGQSCVVLDGRVDADDRQALVVKFRDDKNVEILLATIDAAGVGFTLTAAWLVIFGELDWVPSKMRQAEDRLNRIGQKESVHAMYLVARGTLDERQFQLLIEKQEIADAILDR